MYPPPAFAEIVGPHSHHCEEDGSSAVAIDVYGKQRIGRLPLTFVDYSGRFLFFLIFLSQALRWLFISLHSSEGPILSFTWSDGLVALLVLLCAGTFKILLSLALLTYALYAGPNAGKKETRVATNSPMTDATPLRKSPHLKDPDDMWKVTGPSRKAGHLPSPLQTAVTQQTPRDDSQPFTLPPTALRDLTQHHRERSVSFGEHLRHRRRRSRSLSPRSHSPLHHDDNPTTPPPREGHERSRSPMLVPTRSDKSLRELFAPGGDKKFDALLNTTRFDMVAGRIP